MCVFISYFRPVYWDSHSGLANPMQSWADFFKMLCITKRLSGVNQDERIIIKGHVGYFIYGQRMREHAKTLVMIARAFT
jgi:hypothetical protein